MSKNKQAIITFANLNNRYIDNLARLGNSLRNNFKGDFLAFIGEGSCGAESHETNPYSFKIHCFERAIEAGYRQILWLDTSCFAIKTVSSVFDRINEQGYIMQEAGHMAGTWTNDKTLEYFNYTRDEAMKIRMYGNAGFLGLNFQNDLGNEFFIKWKESMLAGCFKGAWNNIENCESYDDRCKGHRHDMSCGSLIAHDYKFELQPGDQLLQYAGLFDETMNDTIIFKAQG